MESIPSDNLTVTRVANGFVIKTGTQSAQNTAVATDTDEVVKMVRLWVESKAGRAKL